MDSEIQLKIAWGVPYFNEIVLLVKKKKLLLVTDLAFHIEKDTIKLADKNRIPFSTSYAIWGGMLNKIGVGRDFSLMIRDKAKFSQFLQAVAKWDFDSIGMAHGRPVVAGDKNHPNVKDEVLQNWERLLM
jgi:hypothetical protein